MLLGLICFCLYAGAAGVILLKFFDHKGPNLKLSYVLAVAAIAMHAWLLNNDILNPLRAKLRLRLLPITPNPNKPNSAVFSNCLRITCTIVLGVKLMFTLIAFLGSSNVLN